MVIAVLLLLAMLVGTVFYLTRPARLAMLTGELLETLSAAQVNIQSARIHLDGSIELHGVSFEAPNPKGQDLKLFDADVVIIKQNLAQLLRGRFMARSITFIEPKLYLTEDLDQHLYNYELLQAARLVEEKKHGSHLPDTLPQIIIREGVIQFGEVDQNRYNALGVINLSGRLSSVGGNSHTYTYLLQQKSADGKPMAAAPTLSGQFNLKNLAVTAQLDRFTLEGSHRQILPRKLRKWWDQFEPEGSLPQVLFGYDPKLGLHAVLEVKDASLTLPYSDPPVRMTHVSGKFTVAGDKSEISHLTGQIDNIPYEINGQIDGLDPDSPFSMTARISQFNIPKEPRYLLALPRVVQKQFLRFTPTGTFSALVKIKRLKSAGEIQYDGLVEVNDVQSTFYKFPYPLKDVHGQLRFNNEEVRIVGLHGKGLGGGSVSITGRVWPPHNNAAVDMDIRGTAIPIDDYLRHALDDSEREVVDNFFDHAAAARLEKLGLIQTTEHHQAILEKIKTLRNTISQLPDPKAQAGLELQKQLASLESASLVPVFDLGGTADIKVHLTQDYGPHTPHVVNVTIDASNVSIITEAWNYPIKITQGNLLISPGKATLQNFHVQGLTGVTGSVTGSVTLHGDDEPDVKSNPDVHFVSRDMPVDALLLASIPEAQSKWIKQLDAHALVKLTGKVYRTAEPQKPGKTAVKDNHNGPMDFDIHAQIQDQTDPTKQAHARPFGGRITIKPLTGKFLIHRQGAQIESLAGMFGDAKMSLTGQLAWQDEQTSLNLDINASHVNFNQPVLDLVPSHTPAIEALRKQIDLYQPSGLYDASVALKVQGDNDPDYLVKINPQSLSLTHNKQPIHFDRTQGQVRIDPKKIILDRTQAWFDQSSTVAADGRITLGDQPRAVLNLAAKGRRLDPITRSLLPESVDHQIDQLSLAGGYQLQNAKLVYRPKEEDRVVFNGQVRLINFSADLGVPIEKLQGVLDIGVLSKSNEPWPQLKVALHATKLNVENRLIEQLQATLLSADQAGQTGSKASAPPGLLLIPKIHGQIYNGQLLGQAAVQLGDKPSYSLQLTIQDAALAAMVEPDKWKTMPTLDPMDSTAYAALSASLALKGTPGDIASRQGRGRLDVRHANLYQTPFALTLLQILSLTLPSANAFDRAKASYIINGDHVNFDSIRFETPSLALTGKGTMVFTTQKLDLDFVTRNITGPAFGPISDLVSVVKDQIVAIHVGGTLDKPVTSVRSFSGVGQTWDKIFGNSKDDKDTSKTLDQDVKK